MKEVLVATDGSDDANRAFDYATQLAKSTGASPLIVNIIGGYGLPSSVVSQFTHAQQVWLRELLESTSAEILTKAQIRARTEGAAVIRLESRSGEIVEAIIDVARENNADTIVIGKRGLGRVAGLLLGSVSQKLVSLAILPVTVVP